MRTQRRSVSQRSAVAAVCGLVVAARLFVLTATPVAAVGVNRYVATTGSDTLNDCTNVGTPCLTIGYAVSQAADGDTINVAPGTYQISSKIDLSGGVANNLTIAGAGAATTTVQQTATTASNSASVFSVAIGHTVSITGLTITGGNVLTGGGGIFNAGTIANLTNDVITGNHGG